MTGKILLGASASLICSSFLNAAELPDPTSTTFCGEVQAILANTEVQGEVTLFDNMPDYRHSKPMIDPLTNYQVVTYREQTPIMVSCKIKGAAHIRSGYGDDTAGEQQYCPTITRMTVAQAAAELAAAGDAAAAERARGFVVDENEPYMTGRDYLSDFELSYTGDDGVIHLQSPGLFHDYDSWTTIILPEKFEGQTYCHLATADYVKALATGDMEPGTKITTADDAPVQPY
ncbi:MAG: hypothetical protein ACN4GT_14425 [Gammaproteobacteria bacterium]